MTFLFFFVSQQRPSLSNIREKRARRTAASTFNHQLDALDAEDAQASHRSAESPSRNSAAVNLLLLLQINFLKMRKTLLFGTLNNFYIFFVKWARSTEWHFTVRTWPSPSKTFFSGDVTPAPRAYAFTKTWKASLPRPQGETTYQLSCARDKKFLFRGLSSRMP